MTGSANHHHHQRRILFDVWSGKEVSAYNNNSGNDQELIIDSEFLFRCRGDNVDEDGSIVMDMSFQDIDVDQMSNMECARNLAYSIQQRKIRQQSALRQLVSFLNAGRAWLDETHAEMSAIIHRRNKKWSRVSDSVETIIQNVSRLS